MNTPLSISISAAFVFAAACTTRPSTASGAATEVFHSSATQPEVRALADQIRGSLKKARYMEGDDLGAAKVAGWEGFPTRKYRYTLVDTDGTKRTAEVVMMNPSAEMLAGWILSASHSIKGKMDPAFCQKLFKHVISCSGGQFVVRGICLEDMDGNGIHKAYPFQDGVTVRLKQLDGFQESPLTAGEQQAALESTPADVTVFSARARLQSSVPADWAAYTGSRHVSGVAWLRIVRTEYQKAWTSPQNPMLTATATALGL